VSDDRLVEATYDNRVASVAAVVATDQHAAPDERALADRTVSACTAIGSDVAALAAEVGRLIGMEVGVDDVPSQRRSISVPVADHAAAEVAADLLEPHGFVRWQNWSGGARRSFARHASEVTLARTTDVADVVRLRWKRSDSLDGLPSSVRRALRPTEGDWAMVQLPSKLWRMYSVVRLGRLAAERLRLRPSGESGLGPFLATPTELIGEIGRFAAIGPDDVVADLGCGDGRIAIELAQQIGCRTVGIESDADLVRTARERVRSAGLVEQVSIVHDDARNTDLSSSTVVILFLPADVVAELLPALIDRLTPGTRIVAHEQHRPVPGSGPRPEATGLMVGAASLSVAHRWTVR
jgi:SAM-dependent methyltransferase